MGIAAGTLKTTANLFDLTTLSQLASIFVLTCSANSLSQFHPGFHLPLIYIKSEISTINCYNDKMMMTMIIKIGYYYFRVAYLKRQVIFHQQ